MTFKSPGSAENSRHLRESLARFFVHDFLQNRRKKNPVKNLDPLKSVVEAKETSGSSIYFNLRFSLDQFFPMKSSEFAPHI